jgi:hypothetical protein
MESISIAVMNSVGKLVKECVNESHCIANLYLSRQRPAV